MKEMTYRAGIIGLGFIGGGDQVSGDRIGQRVENLDGTHREALSRHPRVKLAAGSSRDPGRRDRFVGRTGAAAYSDWREMLEKEDLDIVGVASFARAHADPVVTCAERGVRAIYCEKPMATRLADAERMIAACERSGSLLVLNHNRRFHPNYRGLRDRIAAGGLGDLTSASLRWGSGRLGNVGTHFIDALCMLTGRRVAAVSAALDLSGRPDCRGPEFRDPGGWGMLRMEGGLMAMLDAADYGAGPVQLVLNGTLGRAITGMGIVELETWPVAPGQRTSMDRSVDEIVSWLDAGGGPFDPSPAEGLKTLEVIVACHVSHSRNAAWVDLPLSGADRELEVNAG